MIRRPPRSTLFPYPPLFRSAMNPPPVAAEPGAAKASATPAAVVGRPRMIRHTPAYTSAASWRPLTRASRLAATSRSEEHTSELQSHLNLVCRLLLEKKKQSS